MAVFFWRGGTGIFGLASNWDTNDPSGYGVANTPPGQNDTAVIGTSGSISGTLTALELGFTANASIAASTTTKIRNYTTIDGATVTVSASWQNSSINFGVGVNSSGTLNIGSSGNVNQNGQIIIGGFGGSSGTVSIARGGRLSTSGPVDTIGNQSGASRNSHSRRRWLAVEELRLHRVGNEGKGSLTVSDGGSVNAADLIVAAGGGTGKVLIESGSSVTTTGANDGINDVIGSSGGASGAGSVTIDGQEIGLDERRHGGSWLREPRDADHHQRSGPRCGRC